VHEGEILALLGRNGAGKTSTLRSIARVGAPQVTYGEIWLDHQPLHKMNAHQAAVAGCVLVPEDRRIIPGLTVEENLQLAQIVEPTGWSIDRLYDLFPRLGERRKQEGVTLSGGEQQMLAIARALARDIKVLLLDEPYEGLAPVIDVCRLDRRSRRVLGRAGQADRLDQALHQGQGHLLRPPRRVDPLVRGRHAERLRQLRRPPPGHARRPDRDHLGTRRPDRTAQHITYKPSCTARSARWPTS
jgi:ABC-type transport system involved in cytochrome c biogenesis ATPase subunit